MNLGVPAQLLDDRFVDSVVVVFDIVALQT